MANEFQVHRLNEAGLAACDRIADAFDKCLKEVQSLLPGGRELALVVTKMQEANFFAKRGIAVQPHNQVSNQS